MRLALLILLSIVAVMALLAAAKEGILDPETW